MTKKKQNVLFRVLLAMLTLSFFSVFWVSLHDIIEGEESIIEETIAAILSFFGTGFTIFLMKKTKSIAVFSQISLLQHFGTSFGLNLT